LAPFLHDDTENMAATKTTAAKMVFKFFILYLVLFFGKNR
jgi:hypothetical protein